MTPDAPDARPDRPLPLAGIRVLEFTQLIMGPAAGLILADLGAEVIKVEPAPGGDPTRSLPGFAAGFFGHFNRNKKSVAIDLKQPAGVALAHRLIGQADVLIENFAPGTMDRLGCGYAQCAALNSGLIYCALKGFMDGPYGHRTALDEVVQFMGGLAYMTGPAGRPLRAGTSVVDLMGASMASVAILAALRDRERTGMGQRVGAGLFETTAFMMGQHMAAHAVTGEKIQPMPEKRGGWSVYETFPTADGASVFVALTSNKHWRAFCHAFGLGDLAEDTRLATNDDRLAARSWMLPKIAAAIASRSKAEVLRLCDAANVPFAPVAEVEDLFDDLHLDRSGMLLDVGLKDGVRARLPRLPIRLGAHDLGRTSDAPHLGADTRDVLGEAGVSAEELDTLEAAGVIA